jgi:hypothetical protein
VAECLPSKCKALSSNSSTAKKKEEEKNAEDLSPKFVMVLENNPVHFRGSPEPKHGENKRLFL